MLGDGALFLCGGQRLSEPMTTYRNLGGLAIVADICSAVPFFSLASIGCRDSPALWPNSWCGLGLRRRYSIFGVLAVLGIILSAAYIFGGTGGDARSLKEVHRRLEDLTRLETEYSRRWLGHTVGRQFSRKCSLDLLPLNKGIVQLNGNRGFERADQVALFAGRQ